MVDTRGKRKHRTQQRWTFQKWHQKTAWFCFSSIFADFHIFTLSFMIQGLFSVYALFNQDPTGPSDDHNVNVVIQNFVGECPWDPSHRTRHPGDESIHHHTPAIVVVQVRFIVRKLFLGKTAKRKSWFLFCNQHMVNNPNQKRVVTIFFSNKPLRKIIPMILLPCIVGCSQWRLSSCSLYKPVTFCYMLGP